MNSDKNILIPGERAEAAAHFLQEVQSAQAPQSISIQKVQGTTGRPGSSSLRQKTTRLRWPNEAYFQKKGTELYFNLRYFLFIKH